MNARLTDPLTFYSNPAAGTSGVACKPPRWAPHWASIKRLFVQHAVARVASTWPTVERYIRGAGHRLSTGGDGHVLGWFEPSDAQIVPGCKTNKPAQGRAEPGISMHDTADGVGPPCGGGCRSLCCALPAAGSVVLRSSCNLGSAAGGLALHPVSPVPLFLGLFFTMNDLPSMPQTSHPDARLPAQSRAAGDSLLPPPAAGPCGTVTPVSLTGRDPGPCRTDRKAIYADQEPVTARSLSPGFCPCAEVQPGLSPQVAGEHAVKNLTDVSITKCCPDLVAGAGYASRNNDSGGRSIGIEDRVESLRPSTSQGVTRTLANLTFSWNALVSGVRTITAPSRRPTSS